MNHKNILNTKTKKEFRQWLEEHHLTEKECWIKCKRGKPTDKNIFYYIDAVYTALSFGWIDSTYGLINGTRMQRFSPRRKNSHWSELNKERCRWLIKHNLMTQEGFKKLPNLDEQFIINQEILKELKKDEEIWKNFKNFPELYKKIRISNIQKEQKNTETYNKMLNNFLKNTKQGKMYGNWNDYGRL